MRKLPLAVLGLLLVAGAAALVLAWHRSAASARAAVQALRAQAEGAARLETENERLSNLLNQAASPLSLPTDLMGELLKLRGEVGRLRQEDQENTKLRDQNRQLRMELAAAQTASGPRRPAEMPADSYWPKESWTFAGYDTPEAAWRSTLWAASTGDLRAFTAGITGQIQQELEAEAKDKSEAQMLADIQRETTQIKSCRLVSREVLSDDEVVLAVDLDSDTRTEGLRMRMKKVGAEWKYAGK